MKKILSITLITVILLINLQVALAAGTLSVNAQVNNTNGEVVITGTISSGAGEKVTLLVMNEDTIAAISETSANQQGNYEMTVRLGPEQAGTYTVKVKAAGLTQTTGMVYSPEPVIPSAYTVTFHVTNSGAAVQGAAVILDGQNTILTNASGDAAFSGLINGTYSYVVSKAGFVDVNGSVTVNNSNVTRNVALTAVTVPPSTYSVTFHVTNSGTAVQGVAVILDGQNTILTNASGDATFSGLINGTYNCAVSGTGFIDFTGSVTVNNSNVTKNVVLTLSGTGGNGPGSNPDIQPAPVKSSTIEVPKPAVDPKSGDAAVKVDAASLQNALNQAENNAEGVKVATVVVPKAEGATSYTPVLPAAFLTSPETNKEIEIKTDIATVVLPSNMMGNANIGNAKEIAVTVGIAEKANIPEEIKAQIGNRTVLEINVSVDGVKKEYNNPGAPVKISIPYTPTAEEAKNPEHIVIWYIDGSGKAVSVPNGRYNPETGMVTFRTTHFSRYAVVYVFKTFADIAGYEWAKDSIEIMASKGIINGTGATTFTPDAYITRADFLALLIRSFEFTAAADENFSDVKPGDYFYKEVGIAKKLGLAQGQGDNKFNPYAKITRQDMMVISARAMRIAGRLKTEGTASDLNAFADKSGISAYAQQDVAALIKMDLIQGNAGKVNPLNNTTRAEAAVLLYRIYKTDK